jgi:hypothetical protein
MAEGEVEAKVETPGKEDCKAVDKDYDRAVTEAVAYAGTRAGESVAPVKGFSVGKQILSVTYSRAMSKCIEKTYELGKRMLLNLMQQYFEGKWTPVRPINEFPGAQVADAFRFMQKGTHIGKIMITIPHAPSGVVGDALKTTKRLQPIVFNPKASYLLIGGLGGLGKAISRWMAEGGASELIYLSRSAGTSSKDDDCVHELESMGYEAWLITGSVSRLEDVERAISSATYPLKGVVQMSMVLRDQNWSGMSLENWNAAVEPKVTGTGNLHEVTKDRALDFFVLFSSISGIIGNPGQLCQHQHVPRCLCQLPLRTGSPSLGCRHRRRRRSRLHIRGLRHNVEDEGSRAQGIDRAGAFGRHDGCHVDATR